MQNKKHVLEKIHHLIVGFFLTLKGVDKISHHYILGGLILGFGITILTYFFYKITRNVHNKALSVMVHLFEALALLFTAYIYYSEGKVYLPYVVLLASVGFFISVIILMAKKNKVGGHH